MAKRGSSFGGWVIIGLLVLGISQCFKSPDKTAGSAVARAPIATPGPITAKPSTPALAAPPPAEANKTIEIRFVTATSLNVRATPSTDGSLMGKIPNGHQIAVIEKSNGWLLVQSVAAGLGWVSEQFTSKTRPAPVYRPPAKVAPVYSAPARASSGRYITGPRGGCYYINRNGNKTYVDRILCR